MFLLRKNNKNTLALDLKERIDLALLEVARRKAEADKQQNQEWRMRTEQYLEQLPRLILDSKPANTSDGKNYFHIAQLPQNEFSTHYTGQFICKPGTFVSHLRAEIEKFGLKVSVKYTDKYIFEVFLP